jgi:hypothetical protein
VAVVGIEVAMDMGGATRAITKSSFDLFMAVMVLANIVESVATWLDCIFVGKYVASNGA